MEEIERNRSALYTHKRSQNDVLACMSGIVEFSPYKAMTKYHEDEEKIVEDFIKKATYIKYTSRIGTVGGGIAVGWFTGGDL